MIVVKPPSTRVEFDEACQLVEGVYQEYGYVQHITNSGRPSKLFVAMDGTEVIGTVGLFMNETGKLLPTEVYFNFKLDEIEPTVDRSKMFEIGRLAVKGFNVAYALPGLVVAICEYAGMLGLRHAVACMKPHLCALLRRMKVNLIQIDAELVEQNVDEAYRGYFLGTPTPKPVYFRYEDLALFLPHLQSRINGLVEVVILEKDNFRLIFDEAALVP